MPITNTLKKKVKFFKYWWKNRSILDLTNVTKDYLENPNFSCLDTFLPIVNYDINLLKTLLKKENIDAGSKQFIKRLESAKHWINNYGLDYNVKLLEVKNEKYYCCLSEIEKEWVRKTLDLINMDYPTSNDLQTALYNIVKEDIQDEKELKIAQKKYFQILYNLLLRKDQGPKLGLFLMAIDRERVKYLFS